MPTLYVDADACPVKEETIRVASRHQLTVFMVSNGGIRPSSNPLVHIVVVAAEADAADHWIVDHIQANDIVITADILLAQRCLHKQAIVISPNGTLFTDNNIGTAVAMRNLHSELRETGELPGHNAAFSQKDRSRFLQSLENTAQKVKML